MSLQVWLPLTKDLRQQGISSVIATNSGTTYSSTGGKLGGCYTIAPTSGITLPASAMTSFTTECSVSFWIKINSWKSSYDTYFQAGLNSTPWAHYRFGILRYNTGSNLCFTITNSSGSSSSASYITSNLETGVWYHLVFTYTAGKVKCYRNGVLDKEYTTTIVPDFAGITNISIGRGTNGSSYPTDCNMNDFRIYDHCLSPMEVKELSRGLVLHYPLNRNGWGQENLITGTDNWSTWYKGNRWTASDGILTYSAGSVSWVDADSPCIPWSDVNGKTITVSVDLKSDDFNFTSGSGFSLCFVRKATQATQNYSNRRRECTPIWVNSSNKSEISSSWKTFTYTYTNFTDADFTNTYEGGGGDWFGIYLWNYTDKSISIRNIKVEYGNKVTTWCPNSVDTLYTTMGLNGTTEYDCTGLCNNGIKNNLPTYSSNTEKYNVSTYLDGVNQTIQLPNLSTLIPDGIFTFSVWFKKETDKWSSKSWETIFGGPSGFEFQSKNGSTNSPLLYAYSWGKGTKVYTLDEWHHFAMVRTADGTTFYLDGEQAFTGTAGSIPSGNYFLGSWSSTTSQNYKGFMSDARIYATALSADDVLALYNKKI